MVEYYLVNNIIPLSLHSNVRSYREIKRGFWQRSTTSNKRQKNKQKNKNKKKKLNQIQENIGHPLLR